MVKQVIVMRKDLNMRKGKMIAQGSHASLGSFLAFGSNRKFELMWPWESGQEGIQFDITSMKGSSIYDWFYSGQTKITVSVDSEKELLDLYKSIPEGIPCHLVTDAGHTEFNGVPTITCLGIGPVNADFIDKYTGHLKLL